VVLLLSLSLPTDDFENFIIKQVNNFFPDGNELNKDSLFKKALDSAFDRTYFAFKYISIEAFNKDGVTYLSHLHTDQYTVFLWFLSNSLLSAYDDDIYAKKIFYLNKALNGVVCMYDAKMPDIFIILHGTGAMLGKASYSNFFVCCQGVTVGANHGIYPSLGKGVSLLPGAAVVGNCNIGHGVTFAANTLTNSTDIPDNTVRFFDRESGQYVQKFKKEPWAQQFFNVPITL
jgi:serine O-acetyltransferase